MPQATLADLHTRSFMPNYTYVRDIPDAPHNPSVDQPDMKINTNSIDDLIEEDHYSFNDPNNFSGYHKDIHQPAQAADPAAIANIGQLYTLTGLGKQNPIYLSGDNTRYNVVNKNNNGTFSIIAPATTFTIPDIIPDNCYGFLGLGSALQIMTSVPFMIINGQPYTGTFSIQYTVAFIGAPGNFQLQIAKNGLQPDIPNSDYRFIYWPII